MKKEAGAVFSSNDNDNEDDKNYDDNDDNVDDEWRRLVDLWRGASRHQANPAKTSNIKVLISFCLQLEWFCQFVFIIGPTLIECILQLSHVKKEFNAFYTLLTHEKKNMECRQKIRR